MRAIRIQRNGAPDVMQLEDVELPPPGPGEAQVRHHAIGVNYLDVYYRSGLYAVPHFPATLGSEGAGEVTAVGPDVTAFKPGDRVMSRHTLGACAELGNAKADLCDKVPEGMSLEEAGVFRGAYTTAYHALLQRGRMQADEWVLVHGAAVCGRPSGPQHPDASDDEVRFASRRPALLRVKPQS